MKSRNIRAPVAGGRQPRQPAGQAGPRARSSSLPATAAFLYLFAKSVATLRNHVNSSGSWRNVLPALVLVSALGRGSALANAMPAAPAGVSETGAPSFVVLGPEELGLSSDPIDLHLLPDGRTLVVSEHELAFGDGVRWEAFRGEDGQPALFSSVAVGNDGKIYAGIESGIARVDLSAGERWRLTPVAKLPAAAAAQRTTLVSVAALSSHWYWYGGNGAIVSWSPGQQARIAGSAGAIERIFALGPDVYVSDQSSGGLFRLTEDGAAEIVPAAKTLASDTVTCAIPFGSHQLLVGSNSVGLRLFDGKTFRPFGPTGLLNAGHRISDICAAGDGFFAAAIDTVGIVFFDRHGRTVQVLDRTLDHRLARVQSLRYSSTGVLWAMLNEGVVRVEFPSPVSHFEPLIASGLGFAQPLRHDGQLWILADGRAMHGIYDAAGRLERLADETPPGRYLFAMADVDGRLFASNDRGIYLYDPTGWRLILSGIVNARLGVAQSTRDGMYYVARGEYGVIHQTGRDFTARRIPAPDLGDSYGSDIDDAGIGWVELGSSRVGRLASRDGKPELQIFGPADGLGKGWVEIYLLDGVARFHMGSQLCRFDDAQRKFVVDSDLLARLPQLASAEGRPVTDGLDRLWYTAGGTTQVIDRSASGGNRPVKIPQIAFAPTNYTAQTDGVVWLFEKRRLARVDLRVLPPPQTPPKARITSVLFSASNRELFSPNAILEPLDYADNSLTISFSAPANPFAAPVTFEMLLEGAGTQWVSTGDVGSATFNRLKEGDYVFRVRPVVGGITRGAEARLQFAVRPPWYRTTLAWATYIATAVGLLAFVTWFSSYLQHRKNERLEKLVATRTEQLKATNAQLGRQIEETTAQSTAVAVSEERFRVLNAELEDRVQNRTGQLQSEVAERARVAGALKETMTQLTAFWENAPLSIMFFEPNDPNVPVKIIDCNPMACEMHGYARTELIGQCIDLVEARPWTENAANWIADLRRLRRVEGEGQHKRKDGTIFDIEYFTSLIDLGGRELVIGMDRNATARKEAERKLAYERNLLRTLLNSSPDTIYFKDAESRFVLVSQSKVRDTLEFVPDVRDRRAARGLRADVPEAELLTGLTDYDTYTSDDARVALADEQQIVRTGGAIIGKIERQSFLNGKTRWWLTSKMPWLGADGAIIGTFGISKDITDVKMAEQKLEEVNRELVNSSRHAGMAEIATGVLHNVGNVLNSVNVSATLVADHVRRSKAANLAKVSALLTQHQADLPAFLTDDPKGSIIPAYLASLAENLATERTAVVTELENLRKNIEHIKEIVSMQQTYAKSSGIHETVSVPDLVEDALRINSGSLARHDVDLAREYVDRPVATLDKHKVIQILINLIRNAKHACDESGRTDKLITVRTTADDQRIRIAIIDNGVGIPPENLTRIFSHGFTTRAHGHGFGLHSGALAAKGIGGALIAESNGPGRGAIFTLELPYKPGTIADEKS